MIKYSLLCLRNKDPKKILATIIRDTEGLSWNHVEILRHDTETGEKISYGAVSPKSRKIPLAELLKNYDIEFEIPLDVKEDSRICDLKLETLLGKLYSKFEVFLIWLSMIFKCGLNWLPYVKLNLIAELICTELVGEFFIDCCHIDLKKSQEMLSLTDVWSIVIANRPNIL